MFPWGSELDWLFDLPFLPAPHTALVTWCVFALACTVLHWLLTSSLSAWSLTVLFELDSSSNKMRYLLTMPTAGPLCAKTIYGGIFHTLVDVRDPELIRFPSSEIGLSSGVFVRHSFNFISYANQSGDPIFSWWHTKFVYMTRKKVDFLC